MTILDIQRVADGVTAPDRSDFIAVNNLNDDKLSLLMGRGAISSRVTGMQGHGRRVERRNYTYVV